MSKVYFDPAKRIYGVLFAGTTALFWGFLAIFIKLSVADAAPVTVVWFRFAIAFLLLAGFFALRDRAKFSIFRMWPPLLILATLALTLNYIGFATGIDYTSPANGQVFIQLGPVSLALGSVFIFKERLSWRQISGFLLAGMGFALFYTDQLGSLEASNQDYAMGVLWLIVAALAWATYALLQKKLVQTYHAQQLNLLLFGVPIVLLMPFVHFQEFSGFDTRTWLLFVFLGINTLVAYGCLAEAFKYIEANKVSMIITLNPVITFITMAILGAMQVEWIAHENFSGYSIAGALLVLSGALLVILSGRDKKG